LASTSRGNFCQRRISYFFIVDPRTPTIPRDLDSRTSITIDDRTFSIEADDLESLCVLGRGAYGVVEKVKHKQTGTILAVKVKLVRKRDPEACIIKLITAVIYGFRNKLECLSFNTRLAWKGLPGTNTLAYYGRNKFYDTGPGP
jgi:hypothetical protein